MKKLIRFLAFLCAVALFTLLSARTITIFGRLVSIVNRDVARYGYSDEVTFLFPFVILILAGVLCGTLYVEGFCIVRMFRWLANTVIRKHDESCHEDRQHPGKMHGRAEPPEPMGRHHDPVALG